MSYLKELAKETKKEISKDVKSTIKDIKSKIEKLLSLDEMTDFQLSLYRSERKRLDKFTNWIAEEFELSGLESDFVVNSI